MHLRRLHACAAACAAVGALIAHAGAGPAVGGGTVPGSRAWRMPVTLNGVAAVAADDVWAVGCWWRQPHRLFIDHWDGASWSSVAPNGPGGTGHHCLQAVDASTSSDAWAVGSYFVDGFSVTLAEHWDGSRWTVFDTPTLAHDSYLSDVAAISATDVWAVGSGYSADGGVGLIEHWNGDAWSLVPQPSDRFYATLSGVSAYAADDIWVVGERGAPGRPFVEHWNGLRWKIVPAGDRTVNDDVSAVVATSPLDAWAVGWKGSSGTDPALFLHWNGASWSEQQNDGFSNRSLSGIDAVSSDDIWAVGRTDFFTSETVHWDGSSWSSVPPRHPGGSEWGDGLDDISAVDTDDVWAVGALTDDNGGLRGLIEHWNGARWSANY